MTEKHTLYLPENYQKIILTLLQKHLPEAEVLAYGSRVNGDYFEASDLDLVARFPSTLDAPLFRLSALQEAFSDSHLPIFVQIMDWQMIPKSFQNEIEASYFVLQKAL